MSTIRVRCRPCVVCADAAEFDVDEAGYLAWQSGAYVQDAFPTLSANDRELLISGTHPTCWATLMPIAEDECNGICLTGYDVGIPSDAIAAAHPDCPLHGYPRDENEINNTERTSWDAK